jgi:hypothetical protein
MVAEGGSQPSRNHRFVALGNRNFATKKIYMIQDSQPSATIRNHAATMPLPPSATAATTSL